MNNYDAITREAMINEVISLPPEDEVYLWNEEMACFLHVQAYNLERLVRLLAPVVLRYRDVARKTYFLKVPHAPRLP